MVSYDILLSGAIGVIVGSIISSLLDYFLKKSLVKKEFIFKEKAKHYEKVIDKINQICDWHNRTWISKDPKRIQEIISRFESAERVMEHFLKLDPPNFNYISKEVGESLKRYYNFLKKINERKNYTVEELQEIHKKINETTRKIRIQIKKETGL